jgi:hypothetical protein
MLVILYIPIQIGIIFGHQVWMERYSDRSQLRVLDERYARVGILLLVESSSPVVKVWRQQDFPFIPYRSVQFRALGTDRPNTFLVMAAYEFSPKAEWYLELYSAAGHWVSMSPYFGDEPDLSQDVWRSLWGRDFVGLEELRQISLVVNRGDRNWVLLALERHGSDYVAREVLKEWALWNEILASIRSGRKDWIEVARRLQASTDAGRTTSLIATIALALPNAPENVLPLIREGFEIEDVRGFPFIEPTDTFIFDHYNKAKHALEQPLRDDVDEARRRCLATLERQKRNILSQRK